jgi:uncharacterized phiE125 gp8 family phage protein
VRGPYAIELTSAPAAEPVTAARAKQHARVEVADDDDLFDDWIKEARQKVEDRLDQSLITQTWKLYLDRFPNWCDPEYPEIRLPRGPLQSVSSISYVDTAGATQTLSSARYQVDAKRRPGRVIPAVGYSWPGTRTGTVNAVTVTYVAGYGASGGSVPQCILQAIYLTVAHWNATRLPGDLPPEVNDLLLQAWFGEY